MSSEYISYLALLTAIVSLVVSFLALHRDRHVVRVRAVPIGNIDGTFNLNVSVSNSGKRPISINHVLLKPKDHPGLFLAFSENGNNKIDVGESKSCQVDPRQLKGQLQKFTWRTVQELRAIEVYVQDAIGKKHKAVWEGKG
tara:strand:+ start:192 stop:614 length:423 start_codon:yes stop_codon:yes gene_type:complete